MKQDNIKLNERSSLNDRPYQKFYVPIRAKLLIAILISCLWLALCTYLAIPWLKDLSNVFGLPLAVLMVFGIALIPGWANAYLISGLLLDRRPVYNLHASLPPVSVLIAAYNEEDCIFETLQSVLQQNYPGDAEIVVINDGSTDNTNAEIERARETLSIGENFSIRHVDQQPNAGKAAALNAGLAEARHDIIVTVDADTSMYRDSLARLVINLIDGPPNTAAVAGTVLVRNSRDSLITRLQEWDYFLGIAVVKRIQSLYQGTLVAQGAFSAYHRSAVEAVGGWENTVGEDIVLTWALHQHNYRVNYAENAFVFTEAPTTYKQFFRQRQRWARGLIEAFVRHPSIIFRLRLFTPFVYLNMLFPYLDAAFLFFFVPGVIAAVFFQVYSLVGIMTLFLLPLMIMINTTMFFYQRNIFRQHGLKVRKNILGLILYMFTYQLIMAPASTAGYLSELFRAKKSWGTK
ncbi:MAG: glycosyl transferase family 2 [Desulfuromonas sp.]|nr:MAG: glycosyl transferase family 2 [Desulfuromonas sp.]